MTLKAYLPFLLVSTLLGQTQGNVFEKAPPGVDEALRDRIAKFYQAHVDKKPRQAEQYVAEDTKDNFFAANKPAYLSFKIDGITYSDNFTKAKAQVTCEMFIMAPGFPADKPFAVPTCGSAWKLEDGQWYWYVDQQRIETPFGVATPTTKNTGSSGGSLPASIPTSVDELFKSVQADKREVQLSLKEPSSDQVLIANGMQGIIKLHLESASIPGLKVTLDRTEIKPKEQAKINFSFAPVKDGAARNAEVRVVVDSLMGMVIPIRVQIR